MLPGPIKPEQFWSVLDGPRNLMLNFGQNHVINFNGYNAGQMSPGQMLPRLISLWQLYFFKEAPRKLPLDFDPNRMIKQWIWHLISGGGGGWWLCANSFSCQNLLLLCQVKLEFWQLSWISSKVNGGGVGLYV